MAPFALAVGVVAGVVASAAAASPAVGARLGSEHSAGMPKQPLALPQLVLSPARSFIGAFGHQFYSAQADGQDVTGSTEFSIIPSPSAKGPGCDRTKCDAGEPGSYTVVGSRYQGKQIGTADLLVVPRDTRLALDPNNRQAEAGTWVSYHAKGVSKEEQVDLTPYTSFSIWPDGRCDGIYCRATKAGRHIVTGTAATSDRTLTGNKHNVARAILDVVPGPLASLGLTPRSATITAGDSQKYEIDGFDAFGNPRDDQPFFSITPDGSCPDGRPTCTATKAGPHIVTATADTSGPTTARTDQSAITAEATLQVVPGPLASLNLTPQSATITAGGSVPYWADGSDAFGNPLGDYTSDAAFDISPDGFCSNAGPTCTATKAGPHTVTATVNVGHGHVTGTATLRVNPTNSTGPPSSGPPSSGPPSSGPPSSGPPSSPPPSKISNGGGSAPPPPSQPASTAPPRPLTSLVLNPSSAVIKPGESMRYTAIGYDPDNQLLGDRTALTRFSISPSGSCAGATCTVPAAGAYTVTGTVDAGNHAITGTASLRVAATSRDCVPTARQVHGLRVTPGKGIPGTFLRITARLGGSFAHCPLALFLGGSPLGSDLTVRPNGSVSARRTVPADARPGRTEVVLAAADGRTVATTSLNVLQSPTPAAWWRREQVWPLSATAALLLAGAAVAASVSGQRARRQRQWVRQHVRVTARASPGHLIAERDPYDPPTVALRLQPHRDTGTTEITKGGD